MDSGMPQNPVKDISDRIEGSEDKFFTREQTKKARELSPQLTMESEHLLRKLLDLRSESEGLKLEVKRKDANLLILQRDLEHERQQIRGAEVSICLLKVNSTRHEMEDKLIKHTATTKNQMTLDLRNEISFLHQQLREKDLHSEQDCVLRKKMMDDCASLTSENSVLQTQLLEITKQLDIQRELKGENYTYNSSSVSQLLSVKDREEQLSKELNWQEALLVQEKERLNDLMEQELVLKPFHIQKDRGVYL
ncbi:uncharacterized protein [Pyxicephalus adspersus]|uniref:uncharacterized protein n=1 Tax=Pyxicephalus adspersus TaxID=30357 RepID=UPI003B58E22D